MAYTLKFQLKGAGVLLDFKVPKLECLRDRRDVEGTPPEESKWRLQIRIPDAVTGAQVDAARRAVKAKGSR